MARKTTSVEKTKAKLSSDQKRKGIALLERRVSELKALDPNQFDDGDDPQITGLEERLANTLASVYGPESYEYERMIHVQNIDTTSYVLSMAGGSFTPVGEIRAGISRGRDRAVAVLESAVSALREDLELEDAAPTPRDEQAAPSDEVFIVHGHDSPTKTEVARLIERAGLKAVILHEQPNAGKTVIEKLERHGARAGFAVILLTPDDVGGIAGGEMKPRARQNVIAEMGWFTGHLGRSKVCVLKKGELEVPSDFIGVVYTDMDERGAWKAELLKELSAAGHTINWANALA